MHRRTTITELPDPPQNRFRWRAAVIAAAVSAWPLLASGQSGVDAAQRWQAALIDYARDPVANGRQLITLERSTSSDALSPLLRLSLADAHLRAGHAGAATMIFDGLRAEAPGEPWTGLASLGLGLVAARRNDLDEARSYFRDASESPNDAGRFGNLMGALLDAQHGDGDAVQRLDALRDDSDAPLGLRTAAQLGSGYARFWVGDDDGARSAFGDVAATSGSPLASAAMYGIAMAQWRAGDRSGAAETLEALLASAPVMRNTARPSAAALRLDPAALVHLAARAYRRAPFGAPGDVVVDLLSTSSPAAAKAALRHIRNGDPAPSPWIARARRGRRHDRRDGAAVTTAARFSASSPGEADSARSQAPRRANPLPWIATIAALALAGATAVRRGLSGSSSSRRA